jgi:hypothetical protein
MKYKEYTKNHGITINKLIKNTISGNRCDGILNGKAIFGTRTARTKKSLRSPPAITPSSHSI